MNWLIGGRHRGLYLLSGLTYLWALALMSPHVASRSPEEPPLDVRLAPVHIRSASIIEALAAIRGASPTTSVIFSVEVVPFTTSPDKNLTVNLLNASVGQALKSLTAQDSRYTYEVIDSRLIHVLPRGAGHNPEDLLNVRITDLKISSVKFDELLQCPNYFIPQLETVILQRSNLHGYAASILGSADAPEVSIKMNRGTVRDVLNAVSQETEAFHDGRAYGWIYTFRIEKNNPLGGQPTWQVF